MDTLHVTLFHHLTVSVGSQSVAVRGSKVQELLCYLILFRTNAHPREVLAELLWSDAPPEQSRRYLRKTLWQLREAIRNSCAADPETLLQVDQEWIRLGADTELCLDVARLETAYTSVQGAPGESLNAEQARRLRMATDMYTGDLLEGWYQDWCLHERQRLQFMYLAMLDKLIDYCIEHGDHEAGIRDCLRVMEYDPTRERTHRKLMEIFYLAGDRNAAMAQYDRCKEVLQCELGVDPDPRTTETYLRICGMQQMNVDFLAERLQGYQAAIATLQRQLDQDMMRLNGMLGTMPQHAPGAELPSGSVFG